MSVSAAMNELRPCAPLNLKHVLAQELIRGLQAVSDSLLRYNATRMLRDNESGHFLSLCRAFNGVAYPICATCYGRCYPGGAALVMDAKNLYDGFGRLLSVSSSRALPKSASNADQERRISENGDFHAAVNGVTPVCEQTGDNDAVDGKEPKGPKADEKENNNPKAADEKQDNA